MYVLLFSMFVETIYHGRGLSVSLDDVTTGHVCLSVSRLVDTSGSYCFSFKTSFVIIVVTVMVVEYYGSCVSFHCIYMIEGCFFFSFYRLIFRYKYIISNYIEYEVGIPVCLLY